MSTQLNSTVDRKLVPWLMCLSMYSVLVVCLLSCAFSVICALSCDPHVYAQCYCMAIFIDLTDIQATSLLSSLAQL